MHKKSILIAVLISIGMFTSGCGPSAEQAATLIASSWTATPLPTSTALPTAVPTTIPTYTPAVLPSATVESQAQAYTCTDPIGCLKISPADPIHIAYMLVVTGPNSALGIDSLNGVKIAIDDAGGKILGHVVKFDGQDSLCNADGAMAAATKLVTDPTIVAVIGPSCSSEARAGEPLLSSAGFVTISPSNTAPDLTDPNSQNHYQGYFRTSNNDKVQGAAAADFAFNILGLRKAATIQDGSLYAAVLQQTFVDTFKTLGGKITLQVPISMGQTDMSLVMTAIATGAPELIYFPIFMPEGAFIIKQARNTPGLETTKLMAADGLYSPDVVNSSGAAVKGVLVTSQVVEGAPYTKFVTKYMTKFGMQPINTYHAQAYDAFNIIMAAIEKVAVVEPDGTIYIPRQALRNAVAATRDFQGLTGVLACSPDGDCANPVIGVYEYQAGVYPPILIWKQTPCERDRRDPDLLFVNQTTISASDEYN
jgi:branched-chain amino acid transport system substrate-binding protein